jgi:hypothetical protein
MAATAVVAVAVAVVANAVAENMREVSHDDAEAKPQEHSHR